MCYNPIKVNYHHSFKNYRGILIHPYNKGRVVNCGKCLECREQFIESWQVRWREQLKIVEENSSYLLTLTYNDENLPMIITPDGEYKSTLDYSDVQKFIKRLRKRQATITTKANQHNPTIKYHGAGEYGKNFTKRPHYHILITNLIIDPSEIQKIWGKGTVDIGTDITPQTINYVLKYTLKNHHSDNKPVKAKSIKIVEKSIIPFDIFSYKFGTFDSSWYGKLPFPENYSFRKNIITEEKTLFKYNPKKSQNEYRVAEKSFLSKGIGENYLTEENIEYHHKNPLSTYDYYDQKKRKVISRPLPRYYAEKIYNPIKKDSQNKNIYDENKKPVRVHDKLDYDSYIKTPLFQRQLHQYKIEQQKLNQLLRKYKYDLHALTIQENHKRKVRKSLATKRNKNIKELQKHQNLINNLQYS